MGVRVSRLKDEGLSIADNLLTLGDGLITVDDALAIIDLVVGTEFNKASKGKSLEKIAEIEKKYFRGKTSNTAKGDGPIQIEPRGAVQLDEFNRLNQTDVAVGRAKPSEASAAVEIQNELGGTLRRAESADGNVDFVFTDGPMKGKTVDFLFTADSLKKADGINQFFVKNLEGNKAQIISHLEKADVVPLDLRNLNATNRSLIQDFIKTLDRSQQEKIVLIK